MYLSQNKRNKNGEGRTRSKRVTFRASEECIKKLDKISFITHVNKSDVIENLIDRRYSELERLYGDTEIWAK